MSKCNQFGGIEFPNNAISLIRPPADLQKRKDGTRKTRELRT